MKKNKIIELVGWYGVVAILVAYALLSFGVITSNSLIYQILNGTGALGIVLDALKDKNYQPAVLNTVWAIIAIIAIFNILI